MVRITAISAIIVFSLASVLSSQFLVMHLNDAMYFQGNRALKSIYLGDLLKAVGCINFDPVDWPGMIIKNPLLLPLNIVLLTIKGAGNLEIDTAVYFTKILGKDIPDAIVDFNFWNETICRVNLTNPEYGEETLETCVGDIILVPPVESSVLDPENKTHNQILRNINLINIYAQRIEKALASANRTIILLDLSPINMPIDNEYYKEAMQLTTDAILNIQNQLIEKTNLQVFFLVVTYDPPIPKKRTRRIRNWRKPDLFPSKPSKDIPDAKKYNLAEYQDTNFPVIFNIILWFMVAFGFSLLAVCWAIVDMNPGRDTIIYRTTSTKRKKNI